MLSIRLPLNPKAAAAIATARAERSIDLNDLNNLAGWDADAGFASARAKLKIAEGSVSVLHRFIGVDGTIMHEYTAR